MRLSTIHLWSSIRILVVCVLVTFFAFSRSLMAQSHIVSPTDLQTELVINSQARQHNRDTVRQFLCSPKAQKAFASAHINAEQVQAAVSSLSDQEVARLATRVNKAQADFAAGKLTDRNVILIGLGIIALTLIVVVAAR